MRDHGIDLLLIPSGSEESAIPSPRNSSDDSDGDVTIPDPDDSGVVQAVSGNGFQIVHQVRDEAPTWTVPRISFHTHEIRSQQVEAPEWMREADKHMLKIENVSVRSWRILVRIGAVEMRRYEECTASPAPDNDVIVAAVLAVWTDTLISTLKVTAKEDFSGQLSSRDSARLT
jgi:hypothetical protein